MDIKYNYSIRVTCIAVDFGVVVACTVGSLGLAGIDFEAPLEIYIFVEIRARPLPQFKDYSAKCVCHYRSGNARSDVISRGARSP